MTVGRCHIEPGRANRGTTTPIATRCFTCQQGTIRHSMGDTVVTMSAGDAVSIPAGRRHNAENIGDEEAICVISFSTPERQAVGE